MLALASAMGIGRFVYTPILPAMADALGLSKTEAGLIAAANFVGYLAGALLAAAPQLPGGRRAWFLGMLAVGAAATAAVGWPDTTAAFMLLRFAGGVASAFVLVLGSALVLDRLARAGLERWAALHFAGVGFGIALSALLINVLQEAGADWRTLWVVVGAAAAVAVPLAAWLVPGAGEPAVAGTTTRGESGNRVGLPRGLGALTLCHGLFGFGYVVTATFIVVAVRASPELRTRALLRLVRQSGRRTELGVQIEFPITRQDIAEMTSTTLYTVSRTLSAWEQAGVLTGGRRRIVVLDPHALVRLAGEE